MGEARVLIGGNEMNEEITAKSIIENIIKYSTIEEFEYTKNCPDDKNRFIVVNSGAYVLAELLGIELSEE